MKITNSLNLTMNDNDMINATISCMMIKVQQFHANSALPSPNLHGIHTL